MQIPLLTMNIGHWECRVAMTPHPRNFYSNKIISFSIVFVLIVKCYRIDAVHRLFLLPYMLNIISLYLKCRQKLEKQRNTHIHGNDKMNTKWIHVHCLITCYTQLHIWRSKIKLKGKATRKHSLHEKTTASFSFSNVNNIHVHSMIPEIQKNMTTQWCSTGRLFTAATQALNTNCESSSVPCCRTR